MSQPTRQRHLMPKDWLLRTMSGMRWQQECMMVPIKGDSWDMARTNRGTSGKCCAGLHGRIQTFAGLCQKKEKYEERLSCTKCPIERSRLISRIATYTFHIQRLVSKLQTQDYELEKV